ncbi:hypothetical protein [Acinetobacter seifertii]|uniref:hypothetical protein n=1 Tax=Acinetobacter seifertii TaxID=1530123 RepID=UPI00168B5254|nr:hypothetical protein [Acinetobacter seifertii]QNX34122.1 hypothetical protein IC788_01880 [Acinetobacter seifertii]
MMQQLDFDQALQRLVKLPLNSSQFSDVLPVAEALLYSNFLPTSQLYLNHLEKRRLVFLFEKFRRYSCSSVTRRLQLKNYVMSLNLDLKISNHSNHFIDPVAQKLGLNEDLNHLKSELLALQTRHYKVTH